MPTSYQCQNCGQDFDAPRAYCPRCGLPQRAARGGKLGSWAVALSVAFAASIWYYASIISSDRASRELPATPPPAALLTTPATHMPVATPAPVRARRGFFTHLSQIVVDGRL